MPRQPLTGVGARVGLTVAGKGAGVGANEEEEGDPPLLLHDVLLLASPAPEREALVPARHHTAPAPETTICMQPGRQADRQAHTGRPADKQASV